MDNELSIEQIIDAFNDLSCDDVNAEKALRENIRQYLSKFLIHADEDNIYNEDLTLDVRNVGGLSSLLQPHITGMFQSGCTGQIFVKEEGVEKWKDLDNICIEEQIEIVKSLFYVRYFA